MMKNKNRQLDRVPGDGFRNVIFGILLCGLNVILLAALFGCSNATLRRASVTPPHPKQIRKLPVTVTAATPQAVTAPEAIVIQKKFYLVNLDWKPRTVWGWERSTNRVHWTHTPATDWSASNRVEIFPTGKQEFFRSKFTLTNATSYHYGTGYILIP